ncbi:MAG: hypothetical protein ACE5FJ_03450 [Gemmatimonadales bacterium]
MRFVVLGAAALLAPALAQAQQIRGYYLNVGTGARESALTPDGVSDFQRGRLMIAIQRGRFAFDLAYEHGLTLVSEPELLRTSVTAEVVSSGEWFDLQGEIAASDKVSWRHRLDRVNVTYRAAAFEITAGRQTVSWATTLFLSPADPFSPFDPSDPFRSYRAGVDAVRARWFAGPFTELDAVFRPAKIGSRETVTALGRVATTVGNVDFGGWLGVVHDDFSAAAFGTTTLWGAALRAEGVVKRVGGASFVRFAVGVDRNVRVGPRDVYVLIEYQHDELAAGSAGEILQTVFSEPFARGELQVISRDVGVVQASVQLTPLVSAAAVTIVSVTDGSVLTIPSITYSASETTTIAAGVFSGFGAGASPLGVPASEFGAAPDAGYISATLFF